MNAWPNCARRRPYLCGTIVGVCGKLSLLSFPFQYYSHIASLLCPPTNQSHATHPCIYVFIRVSTRLAVRGRKTILSRALQCPTVSKNTCVRAYVCATCVCVRLGSGFFTDVAEEPLATVAKTGRRRKLNTRIVDGTFKFDSYVLSYQKYCNVL